MSQDPLSKDLRKKLSEPVEVLPAGDDDVGTLLLDPSHTEKTFDWRASTGLQDGLAKLFCWYMAEPGVRCLTSICKSKAKTYP